MEHWANILGHVTTPLSLAALLSLLAFPIIKAAAERRTSRNSRMALRYAFGTTIALACLAILAHLLPQMMGHDVVIRGTVQSATGRTVPNATVNFVGLGETVTGANGVFEYSVPQSRSADQYRLIVSAPGHTPVDQLVEGPAPTPLLITLTGRDVGAEQFVQVDADFMVGQFLGNTEIIIPIEFRNPTDSPTTLYARPATLTDPDGDTHRLPLLGYTGQFDISPTFAPDRIPLAPEGAVAGYWTFATDPGPIRIAFQRLEHTAAQESPAHYCADGDFTEYAEEIDAIFHDNFVWKPGEYRLTLAFGISGQTRTEHFDFVVTDEALARISEPPGRSGACQLLQWGLHYRRPDGSLSFASLSASPG